MVHRAFRFRLYPTPEQAETMASFAGAVRFVYNLALEQRRDFWRQRLAIDGHHFNSMSQTREVTILRREVDWIGAVPYCSLTYALRDLDKAFVNFFRGQSDYPTFRKRGDRDGFRLPGVEVPIRSLNRKWALVKVPKIGLVKFRHTRAIEGKVISAAVNNDALGWHISFTCEVEREQADRGLPAIGIDRGVANTLALSDGEMMNVPALVKLDRQVRRARAILSRRKRGSARYQKQRRRLSRLTAKGARCRRDWAHRASHSIAERFDLVGIEALRIPNMTRKGRGKRGLNRSVFEQAWGTFETLLAYKLEERGGRLVKVNPAHTSQECSSCGTIDSASRKSQARYACDHCGFTGHADTNAAINILRRSTALTRVEDGGCPTDETRTNNQDALVA